MPQQKIAGTDPVLEPVQHRPTTPWKFALLFAIQAMLCALISLIIVLQSPPMEAPVIGTEADGVIRCRGK